jgi:hypothetical protein
MQSRVRRALVPVVMLLEAVRWVVYRCSNYSERSVRWNSGILKIVLMDTVLSAIHWSRPFRSAVGFHTAFTCGEYFDAVAGATLRRTMVLLQIRISGQGLIARQIRLPLCYRSLS